MTSQLEALRVSYEALKAENERLREILEYSNWNGCFTGDCPHDTVHDCLESLKGAFADQERQLAAAVRSGELLYHNMDTTLYDRKDTAKLEWKKVVSAYDAAKGEGE